MKRHPVSFVPLLAMLAFAAGCQPFWPLALAGVAGSGKRAADTRAPGAFTRIQNTGSVDLEVEVGPAPAVVIEGDDNLLPLVRTEVRDGVLVLSTEQSYNTRLGLRARITVPRLESLRIDGSGDARLSGVAGEAFALTIHGSGDVTATGSAARMDVEVNGSGDVQFTGLEARQVGVAIRGSGDVVLRGAADTLEATVHGSGDLDAGDLKARTATAELHGSGDARVAAAESVSGRLYGSGDLLYSGSPRVQVERHGSGDAVRR
jgi:hypothetical protein